MFINVVEQRTHSCFTLGEIPVDPPLTLNSSSSLFFGAQEEAKTHTHPRPILLLEGEPAVCALLPSPFSVFLSGKHACVWLWGQCFESICHFIFFVSSTFPLWFLPLHLLFTVFFAPLCAFSLWPWNETLASWVMFRLRCEAAHRLGSCRRSVCRVNLRANSDSGCHEVPFHPADFLGKRVDVAVQQAIERHLPKSQLTRNQVQRFIKQQRIVTEGSRAALKSSLRVSPQTFPATSKLLVDSRIVGPENFDPMAKHARADFNPGLSGSTFAPSAVHTGSDVHTQSAGEIDILFEDEHLVAVNKSAGTVVHPGAGVQENTLLQRLHHHFLPGAHQTARTPLRCEGGGGLLELDKYSGFGDQPLEPRDLNHFPGIVHRLDRGTSGTVVFAKSHAAYAGLRKQFATPGAVSKSYLCVVHGVPSPSSGTIAARIARHPRVYGKFTSDQQVLEAHCIHGKDAHTEYNVIATGLFGHTAAARGVASVHLSVLDIAIRTGRTHQIRVHCADELGCPVVGDSLYGGSVKQQRRQRASFAPNLCAAMAERLFLHAHQLDLQHPVSGAALHIEAPVPECIDFVIREAAPEEEEKDVSR